MRPAHRLRAWSGQLSVRFTLWVGLIGVLLAAFLMVSGSREGEAIVRERILTKTSELGGGVAAFAGPYLDRGRAVELAAILQDFAREGDLRDGGVVADGDLRTGAGAQGSTGAPRFLRKHGTSSAQGYLFSPALPFDEFADLYRAFRAEQVPLRAARITSLAG